MKAIHAPEIYCTPVLEGTPGMGRDS